jgi:hypothetical protein
MESLFIKYDQALELKELGFDEPCFAFFWNTGKFYTCGDYPHTISYHTQNQLGDYNLDSTSAPLYQQAVKFIRDKYNLCYAIDPYDDGTYDYTIFNPYITDEEDFEEGPYKTYEEAEQACLVKLIVISKGLKK